MKNGNNSIAIHKKRPLICRTDKGPFLVMWLNKQQIRTRPRWGASSDYVALVEAAGVEPASESSLTGISPSAVHCFHSLTVTGRDTLYGLVASSCMVRAKLTARTCTAHRRSSPARGPSGGNGRLIRQPRQLYCCQLSLKNCPFYRGQAPLLAIPASPPPSKPVRPHMGPAAVSPRQG